MKQLLFIILFPCLALAQYPGNSNQKITLGEQTTADGLVWRGIRADTTSKIVPFSDTSAYIILDTVEKTLWLYKAGQVPKWQQVGGSTLDTATMLLPYWRSGRFSGVLPVANGGTGQTTLAAAGIVTGTGTTNYLPKFTSASAIGNSNLFNDASGNVGIGTTPSAWRNIFTAFQFGLTGSFYALIPSFNAEEMNFASNYYQDSDGLERRIINGYTERLRLKSGRFEFDAAGFGLSNSVISFNSRLLIDSTGNVGIGTTSPSEKLHVVGNGRFTAVGAGTFANNLNITSDGTLTTATSDEKYKYNILPINYGLNTILQLKPVNFQWVEGEEQDLGFIAQDVADIIPEAVNTNWNSDLLMRYESIIPILTKAIQEQQALIKALEQRIINLENK